MAPEGIAFLEGAGFRTLAMTEARCGEVWYTFRNSQVLDNWFCVVLQPPPRYGWRPLFYPALPEKEVRRMDVRLYVGNLNKSTTEDELRTLFAKAGNVSAVEVIKERGSNESKGFGFITMTDQAEAEKAISMYNAYSLGDHELKVNVAKPRTQPA